jgi:hypothetical protein
MPEITHSHRSTAPGAQIAKSGGIAAIAVLAACALACSIPLLIGVGAVSGLGAIFGGWQWFGIALVVGAAVTAVWLFVRGRRTKKALTAGSKADSGSCGCGTC